MTINKKIPTSLAIATCISLLPASALGNDPASPILEELIVTATKREQNLQDVAVGVSLLSGKAVAEAQIKNAAELATLLPTLNVQASSSTATSSFNIRGIGTQAFSPAVDSSVSMMLDGVVMGQSGMAFIDLVDIERIEVLRGPQGTLYGKNASGGVVHIITADPTPEHSGSIVATAIEEDEYRLGGTVSGPLTDKLSYRLTGSAVDDGGYAKNVYNGKSVNGTDSYNIRAKLLWLASEELEFLLSSDYSKSECDCNSLGVRAIMASDQQEALLNEQLPVVPSHDNQDINNDQPTFNNIRGSGHALTINWGINNYVLTSITSYRNWNSEGIVDLDNRPINTLALDFIKPPETDQNQFSQELRVASPAADWGSYVLGAYYFEQDVDSGNTTSTSLFEPIIPTTTRVSQTDVSNKNAALFGEVNISLGQNWQLTLGGRYTYDDLKYHTSADGTDNIIFPPDGEFGDSLDESDFSPKVALRWDINDTMMSYVSYVSGYKGPAFDTSLVAGGSSVKPETSDAWEAGLKSSWLDNRLILNIAAFYAQYKDFQAQALIDEDPNDQLPGAFLLINAGEVSTQGVEIEFISQPIDNWSITGGLAYTDATIDEFPGGNCSQGQLFRGECPEGFQDLSGGQLPYTPQWKLNLSTDYTIEMERTPFDIILGANLRYQDDVLYEISQDEYTWQDAYTVVDVRATFAGQRYKYRLTAFVKNLLDQDYSSLIFAQAPQLIPHGYIHSVPKYAQRTLGMEIRYDF